MAISCPVLSPTTYVGYCSVAIVPGLCLVLHLQVSLLILVSELEPMFPLLGLQPEGPTSKFGSSHLLDGLPEGGPIVGGGFPALSGHP